MEIKPSARKHDVSEADVLHAISNAMRYIELEMYGQDRLLVIGPAMSGQLLELVLVPATDPDRVIHADYLRRKFFKFL